MGTRRRTISPMSSCSFLILVAILLGSCGTSLDSEFSPTTTESIVKKTVRPPWTVTVTGTVTSVERKNVDKTLRNPKWFVDIYLEPTKVQGPPGKVAEGEIQFAAKESDLLPMVGGVLPKEGETFVGTGRTTDDVASVFELTGVGVP